MKQIAECHEFKSSSFLFFTKPFGNVSIITSMLKSIFKDINLYDWENATQIYPGQGDTKSSCLCYLVKQKSPDQNSKIQNFCAKVIPITQEHPALLEPEEQEKLMREIIIHSSLHHPAILPFVGFNMYQSQKIKTDSIALSSPIILTQFMDGGSLQSLLRSVSSIPTNNWDALAKQICVLHIAGGIRYLHCQGFLHLNLQPSSILFHKDPSSDKLLPCISGFKHAHLIDNPTNEPFSFDPDNKYLAPDVRAKAASIGEKTDIYSFGLLVYSILTNNLVTDEITTEKIRDDLESVQISGHNLTKELVDFIMKCFDPEPFEDEIKQKEESNIRANQKKKKDDNDKGKEENEKLLIIEYIYSELISNNDLTIYEKAELDDLCLPEDDDIFSGKKRLQVSSVIPIYPPNSDPPKLDDVIPGTVQPEEQLSDIMPVLKKLTNSDDIKHFQLFCKLTRMAMEIINTPTSGQESIAIANNFLQGAFGTYIGDNNNSSPFNGSIIGDGAAAINLSPNIRVIADGAFSGKDRIRFINLPMTLTQLGKRTFCNCTNLVWINLNIPGITEIPERCFEHCHNLQYIEFPQNLTHIRKYAFSKCYSLPKVELPPTLQHIGTEAFSYCKSLNIISIPKTCVVKRKAFPNFRKIMKYNP